MRLITACLLVASGLLASACCWPAATVTQPAPPPPGPEENNLKGLQVERPAGPFIVRGKCSLETYYDGKYRSAKDTHYCVHLSQSDPYVAVRCYILRATEDGRKLFQILSKTSFQLMTLECEFAGKEDDVVTLLRVVKWD